MTHDIIERFRYALTHDPRDYNCIGAAYFLVGIDDEETYRPPGRIEESSDRLIRVASLDETILIGHEFIGSGYEDNPGHIVHLMVINPEDRREIIHREIRYEKIKTKSTNLAVSEAICSQHIRPVFFSVRQ